MYSVALAYSYQGTWYTATTALQETVSDLNPASFPVGSLFDDILVISKSELCSKFLGISYIEDQIPKNTIFVVAYNSKTPIGYVMASFMPDNGVYLDVICALERKGPTLLSFFIALCRAHFKVSYIQLSSLMHVLTFYPKYGFSHRKSCAEPPALAMSSELSAYILEKMRAGVLASDEAFFDDPKIARFMSVLHMQGFTKTHDPPSCQDPSLSVAKQKQRSCGKDGYTMIKCLGESEVPPARQVVPFEDYVPTAAPKKTGKSTREVQQLLGSIGSVGIATRSLRGSRGAKTRKSVRPTRASKGPLTYKSLNKINKMKSLASRKTPRFRGGARFFHYSETPIESLKDIPTSQVGIHIMKPNGLWLSEEDSWKNWWDDPNFNRSNPYKYEATVDLSKLYVVDSIESLDQLQKEYYNKKMFGIDWSKLSEKYAGIQFTNYPFVKKQFMSMKKYSPESMWFATVDVNSICIWRPSEAILSFTKST